ncbi:hypothetical protein niasHS_000622 [Heterodera schachtii]|uniref:URB1 C-terminal domain-containing protein n=1 Tax=Heterodera schachtii TaxID=97005 RepID=A0ABD2K4T7_HETSC
MELPVPTGNKSSAERVPTDQTAVSTPNFRDRIGPRCDLRFLAGLLRRYQCSVSGEDRLLFSILELLEKHMALDFRIISPLVFGPSSKTYYEELIQFGRALHKHLTPEQVLAYFDSKRMWKSLLKLAHFDRYFSAALSKGSNANAAMEIATGEIDPSCYDPRFVLRLLVQLIAPGTKLSCRPIVQSNALSFALASTSFQSADLRALAYAFLERFRGRLVELSDEHFPQRILFRHMLNVFKNSLLECNERTTHVVSQFLARIAKIILLPHEPIYAPLMSYLTQKPWLQLNSVPEFFKLFFSSSTENCLKERQWILRLLTNGIVDTQDYGAICKVFAVEYCMAIFCTPLADYWTKLLLLKVFAICVGLRSAARDLFIRLDFVTWLTNAISHPRTTPMEMFELIALFRRLVENGLANLNDETNCESEPKAKKRKKLANDSNLEVRRTLLNAKLRINANKIVAHLRSDQRIAVDSDLQKRDEHINWLKGEFCFSLETF